MVVARRVAAQRRRHSSPHRRRVTVYSRRGWDGTRLRERPVRCNRRRPIRGGVGLVGGEVACGSRAVSPKVETGASRRRTAGVGAEIVVLERASKVGRSLFRHGGGSIVERSDDGIRLIAWQWLRCSGVRNHRRGSVPLVEISAGRDDRRRDAPRWKKRFRFRRLLRSGRGLGGFAEGVELIHSLLELAQQLGEAELVLSLLLGRQRLHAGAVQDTRVRLRPRWFWSRLPAVI
mmetsp:Transcript_11128/g.25944  ORF Transcript_11128/g.25944 Transcript_11128/m.25944 type:complete len:233 (-) Transcript_11128:140-838(-)